ncbi:hypothetical protein [Stomatobaculum longum]|uniref:hypothetical protein n=1 Tax=Stomatobaculum longum TaxID=796942 RepID=UPI00280461A2|nr:hypothetical protein [Stomatobaculum longum]
MDDRVSRSRTQEINAYKKRAYKRVSLEIKKADYERIRAAADVAGEPVNAYIKRAISAQMQREGKTAGAAEFSPHTRG